MKLVKYKDQLRTYLWADLPFLTTVTYSLYKFDFVYKVSRLLKFTTREQINLTVRERLKGYLREVS